MQYQLFKDGTAKTFDEAVLVMDNIYAVPEHFNDFAPKRPVEGEVIKLDGLVDLLDRHVGSVVRADLTTRDGDEIVSNRGSEIKQQVREGANLVALSLLITAAIPIIVTLFSSGRVSLPNSIPPSERAKILRSALIHALETHK